MSATQLLQEMSVIFHSKYTQMGKDNCFFKQMICMHVYLHVCISINFCIYQKVAATEYKWRKKLGFCSVACRKNTESSQRWKFSLSAMNHSCSLFFLIRIIKKKFYFANYNFDPQFVTPQQKRNYRKKSRKN